MRSHLYPLPVLQKGAYWRRTCSVLFDDPTDEDVDTRNLSCARLSCNCVCVCVCGSDNSTLHRLMATTDSAHWGIGVLQYVKDTWWTAVRERARWWQLRRWAVNDIPPGVPDPTAGVTSSARGWMNQKLLRVLRELRSAQDSHNYARAKFLQAELQDMAKDLQVPLNLTSAVIVPDVTVVSYGVSCEPQICMRGSDRHMPDSSVWYGVALINCTLFLTVRLRKQIWGLPGHRAVATSSDTVSRI